VAGGVGRGEQVLGLGLHYDVKVDCPPTKVDGPAAHRGQTLHLPTGGQTPTP